MGEIKRTKMDGIAKELCDLYKKDKPESGFLYICINDNTSIKTLRQYKHQNRRRKFHITDIQPIHSNTMLTYFSNIQLVKTPKKKISLGYVDATGVFKISFSDNSIMYMAKWLDGIKRELTTLFVTEKSVWINHYKSLEKYHKRQGKPKPGIFRGEIVNTSFGSIVIYKPLKDFPSNPVIHPEVATLRQDIEFYFNNVSIFTRFNQKGIRKVLLAGEPGTGKSSICMKIAQKYKETHVIAFVTAFTAMKQVILSCSEYKVPVIVIFEDVENQINGDNDILNFFCGIDQPKMEAGSYVIMTTNKPEAIEERISKRPGRIDKIIHFGALKGRYAIQCAKIYFGDELFNNISNKSKLQLYKDLLPIVSQMTGAQIRELANSTFAYAAGQANEQITPETILKVKNMMFKCMRDLKHCAIPESLNRGKKVGFSESSTDTTFDEIFRTEDNDVFEEDLFNTAESELLLIER